MNKALEGQFSELRDALRGMSARFESVERQNRAILEGLAIEGDKSSEMLGMLGELRAEIAELRADGREEGARR